MYIVDKLQLKDSLGITNHIVKFADILNRYVFLYVIILIIGLFISSISKNSICDAYHFLYSSLLFVIYFCIKRKYMIKEWLLPRKIV